MRQFKINNYKYIRRTAQHYFRKKINQDLLVFWQIFKYAENKLELLKEYSQKKYNYINDYSWERNSFVRISRKPCLICNNRPTVVHHIIQIQNGGFNIKNNCIRLCENCHTYIHPWLKKDYSRVIAEKTRPWDVDLAEIGVAGLKS